MNNVLITAASFGKNSDKAEKFLKEKGCNVTYYNKMHLKSAELAGIIKGYDALIVGIDQVDRNVINESDQLKIICMHGTGVDHIDIAAASGRGIYVGNVPGGNCNAVAEYTVGLMIVAARHIVYSDKSIRVHAWKRKVGTEITGKTLGIIGLGHIGKRVVELLSGFHMEILVYDVKQDQKYAERMGLKYVELDELLRRSDVVSLHTDLNEETKEIIAKRELALMKKSAILINTARGELVNEDDLYLALKNKEIGAAGLDAFANEPLGENSKFSELDNIVLTAHSAASTGESVDYIDFENALTIIKVFNGVIPNNILNKNEAVNGKID
ncbi:MAG: phosphoglycerate dehydrogenase [Bacillota bacterium]|jgi:D-3-phosphoglycerate dehydrogenase